MCNACVLGKPAISGMELTGRSPCLSSAPVVIRAESADTIRLMGTNLPQRPYRPANTRKSSSISGPGVSAIHRSVKGYCDPRSHIQGTEKTSDPTDPLRMRRRLVSTVLWPPEWVHRTHAQFATLPQAA